MNRKKKILILCPSFEHKGGVSNYYKSFFKHHTSDSFTLEHFVIGRRPRKESNIYFFYTTFFDYIRLFLKLYNKDYVLVHLNPSLGKVAIIRDSIFLLISKFHNKKVLVFWHGWIKSFEIWIGNNLIFFRLFKRIYGKADAFVALASDFKKRLLEWGFKQTIFLETTNVDDDLLQGFTPYMKINEIKGSGKLKILFISRIEIKKGIMETIDAFTRIRKPERDIELVIAGDGPASKLVDSHIKELCDERINLVGYVRGTEKRKILECSHLMCFPTYYGEGLPTVILECMAFGMPIITTPVGGIRDIFVEGKNGYYVDSLNPAFFSKLLENIILDSEALASMAITNYSIAKERFLSSIVTKRLDNIYKKL